MTKVQSLQRRNLVLAAVAVLLAAWLVLRPKETSAVHEDEMPKLFPQVQVDQVRTVVLERVPKEGAAKPPAGEQRIEIALDADGRWSLASAYGYPANRDKVVSFLEALQGARLKKVVTQRPEAFETYAAFDGWVRAEVRNAEGKTLASFDVGKAAKWPDTYLRVEQGGKPSIVRAYNLAPDAARMTFDSWAEALLWPGFAMPDVSRIEVTQRDAARTLAFVREEETVEGEEGEEPTTKTVWKRIQPDEAVAESFRVEGLVRAFTGMRLRTVVSGDSTSAAASTFGFAEPSYRVVAQGPSTDPGRPAPRYVLDVGAPVPAADGAAAGDEPDAWYVRRGRDPWVFVVPHTSIADFGKAPEDFLPTPKEAETEEEGADAPEPPDTAVGSPDDGGAPGEPLPGMPLLPPDPDVPDVPDEPDRAQPSDGPKEPDEPVPPEEPAPPKEPVPPKEPDAPKEPAPPEEPDAPK